jgi:hypothetical protein
LPRGDDDFKTVIREAHLMARVRHPNVVTVHGESLGMRKEALHWIARALERGFSADYIKRNPDLASCGRTAMLLPKSDRFDPYRPD